MQTKFVIVSGSANRGLAMLIAQSLDIEIGRCSVKRFPDTEVNIQLDDPVREREVFIVQPSCPPVDQNVMEVFAIADACRRAGAAGISWIAPYFGYARSDRRQGRRSAIMGRLLADFAERAGIKHVITVDLHSRQVEGFFHVPVENLTAAPVIAEALQAHLEASAVIVSPDMGRVKMASAYASRIGCAVAVLHKERLDGGKTAVNKVVGDVRGKACVIIDDMISTGATINTAVEALIRAGAAEHFLVAASHAVFTAEARQNLSHPSIRKIIVTNSIPVSADVWPEVKVVSVASILAETIRRSVAEDQAIPRD
jgi:ribose-phosphate pyrophosphokinase